MNCPARPGTGGLGKKCRNPLRPKTVKTRPSNTLAMTKMYFIVLSFYLCRSINLRTSVDIPKRQAARSPPPLLGCVLLGRGFHAVRMVSIVWTAHGLVVEGLVCALSGGGFLRGQVQRLGRLFIAVIFVPERRSTVGHADRQIRALAASVSVGELAIEVSGISRILIPEPVPAFPEAVDVGVMQIEHRVSADGGEIGHVTPEANMSEEVRIYVQSGIEPEVAVGPIDVKLLVEGVQVDPVLERCIDASAAIDPKPARTVIQRAAWDTEHGWHDQISFVAGDWVPIGKRKVLVVQNLTNDSLKLNKHQSMPGQEEPLLKLLWVGRIGSVGLAPVPHGFGIGLNLLRESGDDLGFLFHGEIPQRCRVALDPMGVPPPRP